MTERVLRWEIPIDDGDHALPVSGAVLHVAGHRDFLYRVEFWALGDLGTTVERRFRVFGTGQPIPDGYVHRATAARTADGLVWHLFERAEPDPVRLEVHFGEVASDEPPAELRRAVRVRSGGAVDVKAALGVDR